MIEIEGTEIEVDAEVIAKAFDITSAEVRKGFNHKKIVSLCEKGINEDEGRYRLTFYLKTRRLRLVVDEDGTILESTTAKVSDGDKLVREATSNK